MSLPPDPLAALERVAFAEEYAAALRHDLRNKLASIRNATFYLSRRTRKTPLWGEDPNVERLFTIIDESAQKVDECLRGRFGLEGLAPRRVRRVAAREPVELAVACARTRPDITFELALADGEIVCDPEELALALRCLLENAAEASEPTGVVRVEGAPAEAGYVVSVIDRGSGVDPAESEQIFSPLCGTKAGHAGLGLNVARRVARAYGGDVVLAPSPAGATFTLTIPPGPLGPPEPPAEPGGP